MNKTLHLLAISSSLLVCACSPVDPLEERDKPAAIKTQKSKTPRQSPFEALDETQEAAFEALNTIQQKGQVGGPLYSTFVASVNPKTFPDTSFVLTQSAFQAALNVLLDSRGLDIPPDERRQLTLSASKAQMEYDVETYHVVLDSARNDSVLTFPLSGTWILRGVLGRRDVIMEW